MSRLTWNLALHWDWWIVSCCSHLLYWSFRFEVIGSHLGFFGKGRLPFLSLICSYLNTWHFRRAPGMASSSLHPRGLYSLSPQCLVHSARMECAARVHGSQVFFAHLKWYRLKNLRTFFFFFSLCFLLRLEIQDILCEQHPFWIALKIYESYEVLIFF